MDFYKTDKLIIRVQKSNYLGKEFYDFRTFFKNKEEEWKPTQKGFTISVNSIQDFLEELKDFFDKEHLNQKKLLK